MNSQPTLVPNNPELGSFSETDRNHSGYLVSSLLEASLYQDRDGGLRGVAISYASSYGGYWQFSTSNGSTWASIGIVEKKSALLLREIDLVRWIPLSETGGRASISYYAWDQTSYQNLFGQKVQILNNSSSTSSFSTDAKIDTAYISITPENAAPILKFSTGRVALAKYAGLQKISIKTYDSEVLDDGKILSVGKSDSPRTIAIFRSNKDGSIDREFGYNGSITHGVAGFDDIGNFIHATPTGSIFIAGTSSNNRRSGGGNSFSEGLHLTKLLDNGQIDSKFGVGGSFQINIGTTRDAINGYLQTSDGNHILVATSNFGYNSATGTKYKISISKITENGVLDTGFGSGGIVSTSYSTLRDYVNSATLQSDGKIVIAGTTFNGTNDDILIARYSSSGILDKDFGDNGFFSYNLGKFEEATDVAIQADGKIAIIGNADDNRSGGIYECLVLRIDENGKLDNTFGEGGVIKIQNMAGRKIGLQSDGKIIVFGNPVIYGSPSPYNILYRITTDGNLDTEFGNNEPIIIYDQMEASINISGDDKILISGRTNGSTSSGLLYQYTRDGIPDNSFNQKVIYLEKGAGVLISGEARVIDNDASFGPAYNGATLRISRDNKPSPDDIYFSYSPNLTDLIEGSEFYVYSVLAGVVSKNSDGILELTFNSSATASTISSTAQNIGYKNTSNFPPENVALEWTISDGNYMQQQGPGGPLQSKTTTIVSISRVNDPPSGAVYIIGNAIEGNVLTAANNISDPEGYSTIEYHWNVGDVYFSSGDYIQLSQEHVGKRIVLTAAYIDGGGTIEQITSAATEIVIDVENEATGTLSIIGAAEEGRSLTASLSNVLDADGATTIAYRWQELIDGTWTDLSGATAAKLSVPGDQSFVGKQVRVVATTTDALGGTTEFNSEALLVQAAGIPVNVEVRAWKTSNVLSNVEVSFGSSKQATDEAGLALFTSIVEPSMAVSASVSPTSPHGSGASASVTLQDAVSILKMIAGQPANTTPVSRFQSLAADFDGSGTVSLADALGVLRHAVGLQAPKPSWVFVEDGDDALPSILSPGVPGPVTVDVTPPGPIEVNLIGVLRGDVDGSYGVYGG